MPALFIELFSEEIPARMQAGAAADLARLVTASLASLEPSATATFCGPRRIALAACVNAEVPSATTSERGPRISAPEQAVAGFLRKHDTTAEQLRQEGDYWVLQKSTPATPASELIAQALPPLLRRFPWPKSMRWGGTSNFTWVRPLRRIVCLLDGDVVPFDLREGDDDGHSLSAGDLTEGHRFHAPGPFRVTSFSGWREGLLHRRVVAEAQERRSRIVRGLSALAEDRRLILIDDPGLLDEVAGLVEWPVPLLGQIDPAYMDLPPEVMQVSMRVNQRYFALRKSDGEAAPWFGFVANLEAEDGGAAIIAGNERVLRARFADARHFWDLDRKVPLASRLPALDGITFHAKLGSQGDRVRRIRELALAIAALIGADPAMSERAAELAKADLVTGMVGEFPELQGVMGRYYALHDGEQPEVADAIRDHYAPKGPADAVPPGLVSAAVALADKLDQLAGFFAIGEKPTGSGDPFALRRAGLGVIRILRDQNLYLSLKPTIRAAAAPYGDADPRLDAEIMAFLAERLRVQLRTDGARHDVLDAVFSAGEDDVIPRLLARTAAVAKFLGTPDGANLLTGYRRAANILRIEDHKDGPHRGPVSFDLLQSAEEHHLADATEAAETAIETGFRNERFEEAMSAMARLRAPLDAFFDRVTVNAREPELRRNRLRLLARVRAAMDRVADFSKIEG